MYDVDTLFVISSSRGEYVLNDMLSMIHWSATGGSFFTVVVDQTASLQSLDAPGKYQILHSDVPRHAPAGFHRAAGLKWAIDQGFTYRQVIMLSDVCLLMTQTIDSFFKQHLEKEQLGVIGVRATRTYENVWTQARTQLFEWGVPVAAWERPPISLCEDLLIMTPRFVAAMYQQNVLLPSGAAEWPADYGCYVSWICHMLGFYAVSWGFETKQLPPLYISHSMVQCLPAPHLFGQRMLAFAPIDKVTGYSESDIRELYKQQRGERGRDLPKHQPIATGPEQSDVTLA